MTARRGAEPITTSGVWKPPHLSRNPWSFNVLSPPRAGATRMVAWFSPDRRRRFLLSYQWSDGPRLPWIMLNPSVAGSQVTGDNLDPTLRRVRAFTAAAGWPGFDVLNLYDLVDPDPSGLELEDPAELGDNRGWLVEAAAAGTPVVVGWGAHPKACARARLVVDQVLGGIKLLALTVTKAGHPGHPLYVPGAATLTPWSPPWQ